MRDVSEGVYYAEIAREVKRDRMVTGIELGIIIVEGLRPQEPGDIGNAATWPFPVSFRVVRGVDAHRLREGDTAALPPFIEAAKELQAQGVRMITTNCSDLAIFQQELSAAVVVPVLTSAVVEVPAVARVTGADNPDHARSLAILCSSEAAVSERHVQGLGWSFKEEFLHVHAYPLPEASPHVAACEPGVLGSEVEIDRPALERELIDICRHAIAEHDSTCAFVLQSASFVPHAQALRREFGLPVFDLFTLVMQARLATTGFEFPRPSGR